MTTHDYQRLISLVKVPGILGTISEQLSWDQLVMMPKGAAQLRSEQSATLSGLSHQLFINEEIGELIHRLKTAVLDEEQAAQVREIARDYERAKRVPKELVEEISKVTTEAEHIWEQARANNDFASFAPWLERIIDLLRKRAHAIDPGADPYEVMFNDFEPGLTLDEARSLLTEVKHAIVPILKSAKKGADTSFLHREVPRDVQMAFNAELAKAVGYDLGKGRIDVSTHPFTSAYGRITTRFESTWHMPILSTMHEKGHGDYEHALRLEHVGTPLGTAASFSIHESFSRLWENHVGRSLVFWSWIHPRLKEAYGEALDGVTPEQLYAAINRVEPGFIRVDADELTYTLHIIARFELEQELINGRLGVQDLPAAWNKKYHELLGITPPTDALGCLQDVHWSGGAFGYFPCYAIGNMMAAQEWAAMAKEIDLEAEMSKGNFLPIKEWLARHLQQYGRQYETRKLMRKGTGKDLSAHDYVAYLRTKFSA
jgi:carboxypeptidase Taq